MGGLNVNTEKILKFISNEVGINKVGLNIYSVKDIEKSGKIEIIITSRYKSIKVIYEKNSKNINYEVRNKTQTMI